MPITDFLTKNADFYPNDVALVEINPLFEEQKHLTWREYSLIMARPNESYRRELGRNSTKKPIASPTFY